MTKVGTEKTFRDIMKIDGWNKSLRETKEYVRLYASIIFFYYFRHSLEKFLFRIPLHGTNHSKMNQIKFVEESL